MVDQSTSDTGNFGYGQQDPNDSSDDFNNVAFLVRQMIGRLDTMKLVRVESVTAGEGDPPLSGTVDVLPLVNQIDGNGNATPHGTVFGVPWARAQGGKNAVICDPEVGDIGYVVVSDRDISAIKSSKAPSTPGSRRQYNIADGVYVGGVLNVAPDQYLIFKSDGVRLIDKNGNSVALTPDGIAATDKTGNVLNMTSGGIALTPKTGLPVTVNGVLIVTEGLQLGGGIKNQAGSVYEGDLVTSGEVVAKSGTGQVGLSTHTHHQANDSHGDTEVPTNAPTGGT